MSGLPVTLPAAVAAANHGARAAILLDLLPSGRNPIVFGTAPSFPAKYSSRMRAAIVPRGFAPPNNGVRAGFHATYRQKCRHPSPSSEYIHVCFLLLLLLQLLFKLLMLLSSRSACGQAVRLKIPHALRTARVPTIALPSRGFSCYGTFQPAQGYHPP